MRTAISCTLLLLLMQLMAAADGKVFAPVAIREPVSIPDQRALICWSNGTERLVIETRFAGAGTNFAWVVPLPSKPVIEAASSGLFPTLAYLFQARLVHEVTRWYLLVLGGLAFIYLLYNVKPHENLGTRNLAAYLIVCVCCFAANPVTGIMISTLLGTALLLVRRQSKPVYIILALSFVGLFFSGLLLPALSRSKASTLGPGSKSTVEIMEQRRVGAFDTTTITSKDPTALVHWLTDNGFAVSSNALPVISDYVKRDWIFVGAKIARDDAAVRTNTIHPLSFTFRTAEPVYPLKLTGVDNGPVSVELYVFGPSRAVAPGFATRFCTRPEVPDAPRDWTRKKPKTLQIYHSSLREWVGPSSVATKLSATLTPRQMREDVLLRWVFFSEEQAVEYSHVGAANYAANWSGWVLLACVAGAGLIRRKALDSWVNLSWPALVLALLAGVLVYSNLEKVPVRLERWRGFNARDNLWMLAGAASEYHPSLEKVRRDLASALKEYPKDFMNDILGGYIREEDSPGNYQVRETREEIEIIGYDAAGAPYALRQLSKE